MSRGKDPLPFAELTLRDEKCGRLYLVPDHDHVDSLRNLVLRTFPSATPLSSDDAEASLEPFPNMLPPRRTEAARSPEDQVLFRYPCTRYARDPIEVRAADLKRLAPGNFLNDTIVVSSALFDRWASGFALLSLLLLPLLPLSLSI
jgi:hypothetical protein